MNKFLGIVVLGLLLSNNAYAAHSENIDLILPQLKCSGVKLRVLHYGHTYQLYIENPTKKKIKINSIKFLTKNDDIMTTLKVERNILPFHKTSFSIKQSNMMHEFLQKIVFGCDTLE